jgi:hypothetical protein
VIIVKFEMLGGNCNHDLENRMTPSSIGWVISDLTRVTRPSKFPHLFSTQSAKSSKLVVEIDTIEDYILNFCKK